MKTNKILMAMALAAGFTACTSEDVVESTQVNALSNRKVLGDVEFVMGGTDSRFALEDGVWSLETEDAFGAALIDVPNGKESENAWENYNLTKHIQTNYKYAKGEGNVFSTPALMVEGNYVFYAPYNKKHLTRKPLEVKFPIVQTLDVVDGKVDPTSPINNAVKEGYPFFVDYKFLSATAQENDLTINFKHLYSYPEVKFVNESEEDIEIVKFVINLGDDRISVDGTLNLAGGNETVAASTVGGIVGNLFNLGTELKDETGAAAEGKQDWGAWVDYNVKEKNGLIEGATADLVSSEGALSTHVTINVPEGLTVKAGEEVVFNIVMPADEYQGLNIYAMIDAKKGYKYASASITPQLLSGKRYPMSDYVPSTGKLKAEGKIGKTFTKVVEEDEKALNYADKVLVPVFVNTTAELIDAIDDAKGDLSIIAGEEVVYNKSVADAWADSDVNNLIVLSDLTIEGAAAADKALSLAGIQFDGKVIIKSGYVKEGVLANVEVKESANLTLACAVTSLKNEGSVEANEGTTITTADNKGTLKIAHAGVTVTTLNNYGTLNIAAAGTITTLKNAFDLVKDAANALDTFGTVNVSCAYNYGADFEGNWYVKSGGNLINGKEDANVNKVLWIENGGELSGKAVVVNNATLTIAGTLTAPVKMNGVKAATGVTAVASTVSVESTGVVAADIIKLATGDGDETYRTMTVASKSSLFLVKPTLLGITSTYTHNGSVAKSEDIEAPADGVYNRLVITGSVQGNDATLGIGNTYLNSIEVGGSVYENGKSIEFETAANGKLTIAQNLYFATYSNLDISTIKYLSIGGTFNNKSAFTPASTTVVTFNKIVAGHNISVREGVFKSNDIAIGDQTGGTPGTKSIITVTDARIQATSFDLNDIASTKIHIEGTTSLEKDVTFGAATTITVYEGKTLTIPATVTLNASTGAITFATDGTNSNKGVASTATTKVTGQVICLGYVYNAANAYTVGAAGSTYNGWWNRGKTEATTGAGYHAASTDNKPAA